MRNGITFFRNINRSIQREPWVRFGTDDGSGSDLGGGSEIVRFERVLTQIVGFVRRSGAW